MRVLARDVIAYAAAYHMVPMDLMVGDRRIRSVARPRQIAMHTIKQLCPHMSYPAIGRMLGGRDHTTAMHGDRQIAALRKTNPDVDAAVRWIAARLTPSPEN